VGDGQLAVYCHTVMAKWPMNVHHEVDYRCSTTIVIIAAILSRQTDVSCTRYVTRTRTETKWLLSSLLISLLITITHNANAYLYYIVPMVGCHSRADLLIAHVFTSCTSCTLDVDHVIICPIAIAYSMGQSIQVAQLSQRDHAAAWVSFLAKSGILELGDNILRT